MEKHLGGPKADPLKPRLPSLQSLETCWRKYRCGKSVCCYSCCWYLVGDIGCGKAIKVSGREMVAGSTKELKEISAEKFTQKKDKAKMAPTVADSKIWFQAHRGGLREAPGNTMTPFRYTWELGGISKVRMV